MSLLYRGIVPIYSMGKNNFKHYLNIELNRAVVVVSERIGSTLVSVYKPNIIYVWMTNILNLQRNPICSLYCAVSLTRGDIFDGAGKTTFVKATRFRYRGVQDFVVEQPLLRVPRNTVSPRE